MQDEVDGQTRMSWRDSLGTVVVEHYAIDGMAHGVPIDAKMRGSSGPVAPFILDAGISSTFPNHGDVFGKPPPGRVSPSAQRRSWFADRCAFAA
jgi:hypothetical protein